MVTTCLSACTVTVTAKNLQTLFRLDLDEIKWNFREVSCCLSHWIVARGESPRLLLTEYTKKKQRAIYKIKM